MGATERSRLAWRVFGKSRTVHYGKLPDRHFSKSRTASFSKSRTVPAVDGLIIASDVAGICVGL